MEECFLCRSTIFGANITNYGSVDLTLITFWETLYAVPALAIMNLLDEVLRFIWVNSHVCRKIFPMCGVKYFIFPEEHFVDIWAPESLKYSHYWSLFDNKIFISLITRYLSFEWTTNSWLGLIQFFLDGLCLFSPLILFNFRVVLFLIRVIIGIDSFINFRGLLLNNTIHL